MMERTLDVKSLPLKQRIYVGGIDPSRGLTTAEVWHRIETKLSSTNSLEWTDLHCGSCYIQFTLITTSGDKSDISPLSIVKSWFHNVMWKGCKLVVDEARLHFLQRLEEERMSRLPQSTSVYTINDLSSPTDTDEPKQQHSISRYWRIRRGYCGEPIRHIDTQPCDVTSWSMFTRIRERHKKQQEKEKIRRLELLKSGHCMTIKEAQKCAYYNRPIRLRFTDDVVPNMRSFSTSDKVSSSDQSLDNVEETDDSTSKSDKENSDTRKGGQYKWSDDDSDGTNTELQSLSSNGNLNTIQTIKQVSDVGNLSSSPVPENLAIRQSKYAWSDDDDDDDDDSDFSQNNKRKNKRPTYNVTTKDLDEFDSALQLGQNFMDVKDVTTGIKDFEDCGDLTEDVQRNLRILSQLYPEIPSALPVVENIDKTNEKENGQKAALMLPSSGWGASGQMIRFDPSKPQSVNLLVPDDTQFDNNYENEIDVNESVESGEAKNEKKQRIDGLLGAKAINEDDARDSTKGVYEQKKLEQVFKEVREGGAPMDGNVSSATFSFGFDVDNDDVAVSTSVFPQTNFSFNFLQKEKTNAVDHQSQQDRDDEHDDSKITFSQSENDGCPRHVAFEYPNEETLNELVHQFYHKYNDGERIINDVDGWRNDPTVKDKWLKDRLALTQDWKRKRKYALSKKQNRFR